MGAPVDLTYDYEHIRASTSSIGAIVSGKHSFAAKLAAAKNLMIIVGSGISDLPDSKYVFSAVFKIIGQHKDKFFQKNWGGYNVLQRARIIFFLRTVPPYHRSWSSMLTFFFLFVFCRRGNFRLQAELQAAVRHWLCTSGNTRWKDHVYEISPSDIPKDASVDNQNHHGDVEAQYADMILPGATYTEKSATYVNTGGSPSNDTGRSSTSRRSSRGQEDSSCLAGATLPYDDVHAVHDRLREIARSFASYSVVEPSSIGVASLGLSTLMSSANSAKTLLIPVIADYYYKIDSMTRASSTMAKCSVAFSRGTHRPDESEFRFEASAAA